MQPGLDPNVQQTEVLAWFQNRQQIPTLEPALKIASMYCFVPATTAPSERVGSTAGQVFSKRRLRLAPSIAEYIVVCHESRRRVERSIIAMSPQEILQEMEAAFTRAHHLPIPIPENEDQPGDNDNEDDDDGIESDTSDGDW
jgi:hypothetical protein